MKYITAPPKETVQAAKFDECVAELSQETQEYFDCAIETLVKTLNGGGVTTAKALLYAIAFDGRYHKLARQ